MHRISSYRGNRPTYKQTGPITTASAQCNNNNNRISIAPYGRNFGGAIDTGLLLQSIDKRYRFRQY